MSIKTGKIRKPEPLKPPERIDLLDFLINEDKPNGNEDNLFWGAGDQLEALEFYLSKKVKILNNYKEPTYQGECFAIMKIKNNYIIWRDYFGSCPGCDALDGKNGYEYIKNTLSEGNTLQFKSLEDAKQYVIWDRSDENNWEEWKELPLDTFDSAKREE